MTIRIGVIGTGIMGRAHVETISSTVAGARVSAVADIDPARAAAALPDPDLARVHSDGHELIADDRVDAVLVASSSETHEDFVLACLKAGKPVLCEKPLAPTPDACQRIVEAEAAHGSRLVQVGFMRRFDPAYTQLKRLVDAGDIGRPLLLHCAHRNADVQQGWDSVMALTDSLVHDIDIARWLLDDEIVAVTLRAPRATRHAPAGVRDPQVAMLETEGGVLIDVESFVRARYAYDIRCEVVGEDGTAALPCPPAPSVARAGGACRALPPGFVTRFADAYRIQLQDWVAGLRDGRPPSGPSSWDGYAASSVTDACVRSLTTGERASVRMAPRPDLYEPAKAIMHAPGSRWPRS